MPCEGSVNRSAGFQCGGADGDGEGGGCDCGEDAVHGIRSG